MSDIIEEMGQVATLKKAQEPTIDSLGVKTEQTYTDVTITVVIMPLNSAELERNSGGNVSAGMKKAYCKPTYTQTGTDYKVEIGDKIVDWKDDTYRVEKVEHDWTFGETEVYRKAILRRVV